MLIQRSGDGDAVIVQAALPRDVIPSDLKRT
jgi:hypothetical protein